MPGNYLDFKKAPEKPALFLWRHERAGISQAAKKQEGFFACEMCIRDSCERKRRYPQVRSKLIIMGLLFDILEVKAKSV